LFDAEGCVTGIAHAANFSSDLGVESCMAFDLGGLRYECGAELGCAFAYVPQL
jgi:hypothetical protein